MVYSIKRQDRAFNLFLNLVLALIIFANAEAGRLLGIKTLSLQFSAVWPATGFSLAALLLFGFRLTPGIFIGNFAYNSLHLYLAKEDWVLAAILGAIITLGSLAQAVVGAKVIRRYATAKYFATVQDVIIFLFFGGIVTCVIASTVGVLTLYCAGDLALGDAFFAWLTFWLGDTLGIYIITPLLVIWSVAKPDVPLNYLSKERWAMLLVFAVISYFTLQGYPTGYLFIPYGIWVAYRLSFHGATVAVGLIALVIIIPISRGLGPYILNFTAEMILILVSFLEIIASSALLFAGAISERNAAWQLVKKHRLDLI